MSNIYRYLLPKSGGGWLRRYYQHKKALLSLELQSSDAIPMPPLPIFDFTREIDAADATIISSTTVDGWTVSDDGVINGASTSQAVLIRTTKCWENHIQSATNRIKKSTSIPKQQHEHDNNTNNEYQDEQNDNDNVQLLTRPFIRWYGTLNTTIGLESKAQRSGFCAIRSPIFPFDGASLQGLYHYLEIQCRYIPVMEQTPLSSSSSPSSPPSSSTQNVHTNDTSDNDISQLKPQRIFTLNLRVTSALNDDIYQGYLALDHPNVPEQNNFDRNNNTSTTNTDPPFRTFVIPFDQLSLTARGREREFQRHLYGSVDIESIGFLLMDNINGPFQFDIAKIRAVNCLDNGAVFEDRSQFSYDTRATKSSNDNSSKIEINVI